MVSQKLGWSKKNLSETEEEKHEATHIHAYPGSNTFVKTEVKIEDGMLKWRIRDWVKETVDNYPEGAELKTFSFTQSTGVWKGTLLWNFGDPSFDPVKVPFEGVLVQGEDLDGFGTYDIPASYIPYDKNGNPQKQKTYKVKESLPVGFSRE